MTISGYDCGKRKGLSRRRKLKNVGAETRSIMITLYGVETTRSRSARQSRAVRSWNPWTRTSISRLRRALTLYCVGRHLSWLGLRPPIKTTIWTSKPPPTTMTTTTVRIVSIILKFLPPVKMKTVQTLPYDRTPT